MNIPKSAPLLLVLLTGCALSPQTILIDPEVKIPSGNYQQLQKTIQIQVNDARQDRVIGTRGGIYKDTSEITAAPGMTESVQNSLASAFRVLGYNVIGADANATIAVDITDLTYAASGETTIRSVETSATLKATCRNGDHTVTNEYRITDKTEVLKAPSTGENQDMINGTLSSTLQKLVSDPTLMGCINR